jgi:uncharacterized protein YjbI with pentapeptide repeats
MPKIKPTFPGIKSPFLCHFYTFQLYLSILKFENKIKAMENTHVQELIEIIDSKKILDVKRTSIEDSKFAVICMDRSHFEDVSAKGVKIMDANLSDLEIEGAQLGGAYIHNIGMPPVGHPMYKPDARQKPLKFENCDLNSSTITNCNLSGVIVDNCNLSGMKINGILIEDLLKQYKSQKI